MCVIGDNINLFDVEEKNGLKYTCFNRTINDAMANERILDMQGITEALSRYYFSNDELYVLENEMYRVMTAIFNSNIPISFKGAMV